MAVSAAQKALEQALIRQKLMQIQQHGPTAPQPSPMGGPAGMVNPQQAQMAMMLRQRQQAPGPMPGQQPAIPPQMPQGQPQPMMRPQMAPGQMPMH